MTCDKTAFGLMPCRVIYPPRENGHPLGRSVNAWVSVPYATLKTGAGYIAFFASVY